MAWLQIAWWICGRQPCCRESLRLLFCSLSTRARRPQTASASFLPCNRRMKMVNSRQSNYLAWTRQDERVVVVGGSITPVRSTAPTQHDTRAAARPRNASSHRRRAWQRVAMRHRADVRRRPVARTGSGSGSGAQASRGGVLLKRIPLHAPERREHVS